MDSIEIHSLTPPKGVNSYRMGDSDDLVMVDKFKYFPPGKSFNGEHGIFFFCTRGMVQFEYDGTTIKLQKNDMFLYMAHSIIGNFLTSSDFVCRQIWFSRNELSNININTNISLADMTQLKLNPVVHLDDNDVSIIDTYFNLLCRRMADTSSILYYDIIRSLTGTTMLELLSLMRRSRKIVESEYQDLNLPNIHKRHIIDKFMSLLENSDGRIRKVEFFAKQLNITPKYLSTILKETMNRRPSVYIQLFTMKAIEYRLRFTDMTMQEIANDLNFPNASFFGKYFKEHSGMTPLEYRKKYH